MAGLCLLIVILLTHHKDKHNADITLSLSGYLKDYSMSSQADPPEAAGGRSSLSIQSWVEEKSLLLILRWVLGLHAHCVKGKCDIFRRIQQGDGFSSTH